MKSLEGTKTAENLLLAFAGESQARNRYEIFASVAATDGYKQIEKIFNETARNEKEHAERFYNLLIEGFKGKIPMQLEIKADYPIEKGTTIENLQSASVGEHHEFDVLYKEFAKIAEEEGFKEVASAFTHIATVEMEHEKRYLKLIENIKNKEVFKKSKSIQWKCDNCGFVHEGKEAPKTCPSCLKPQDYFEVFKELY